MSNVAEQQARDLLARMGVPNAQDMSAGDLVKLANLIAITGTKPYEFDPRLDGSSPTEDSISMWSQFEATVAQPSAVVVTIAQGSNKGKHAHLLRDLLTGTHLYPHAATPDWSADPPTEQGWYWHWNGSRDCAPFPLAVMWSGTDKKCFVALYQLDPGREHWCDKYGGYWLRIVEPAIPETLPKKTDGWTPLTKAGQVRVGDKLRFTIGDKTYNERAKQILHAGDKAREEVIYDKGRNFYFITAMVLSGFSNHKGVEVLAAAPKKGTPQ